MPSKAPNEPGIIGSRVLATLSSAQGRDFSGQDFAGEVVHGGNFFESIFNGCSFTGMQASQSVFQHTEFTETQFDGCTFRDSSFDHSDFVMANLRDCRFIRCSFQNAEWRDTDFNGVAFEQCIFRNTTTSLINFVECVFDDASAGNFAGSSKRFTVFSQTQFRLAAKQLQFLQTSFGITGSLKVPLQDGGDPLLRLSAAYYSGSLTSSLFYKYFSAALNEIADSPESPHVLRIRYICAICRSLVTENFLSVFALQFLQDAISRRASQLPNERQMLEIVSLALGLRVSVRERIAAIDRDAAELAGIFANSVNLRMQFEHTYNREALADYMGQLGSFCQISPGDIRIEKYRCGSTFVDVLIGAGTQISELFRFIRYSLSLATVAISQAGKLRKEYNRLARGATNARIGKSSQRRSRATRAPKMISTGQEVREELVGKKSKETKSIEVLVDTANERVLVLDGRVQVTITFRESAVRTRSRT